MLLDVMVVFMTVGELTVPGGMVLPKINGYSRTPDGLLVPESSSDDTLPNKIEVCNDPSLTADVIGTKTNDREACYLWINPAAALNRVIAESELDGLRATFGNLNDYIELQNILSLLNKQETSDSFEIILREYYQLIERVDEKIDDSLLSEPGVWDFLKLMSDYLMIQSNMSDLPMSDSLLMLADRGLSTDKPPKKLLDYLSNFDIPKELADRLLDRIDINPNHPLYWWIASKSPDHPTVVHQREAVEGILNDTASITAITDPASLMPFGALLGSAASQQFPKTGLELEANCPVGAVKVPGGTRMGTDIAYNNSGTILELRLDDKSNPDVIEYGPDWLHRYFEVWRWEQTVRSLSSSIHIHSDGQGPLKSAYARVMFGYSMADCQNNNSHGTIEVRTALSGYVGNSDETGFPELPHPALIELLHLCDKPNSAGFALSKARIELTVFRSRIAADPEDIVRAKVNQSILDLELTHMPFLTMQQLAEIVEGIINLSNNDKNYILIDRLDDLDPELRERIVEYLLAQNHGFSIRELARNVDNLEPRLQKRFFEHILQDDKVGAVISMLSAADGLIPELQERIVDHVLSRDNGPMVRTLSRLIGSMVPSVQVRVANYVLDQGDSEMKINLIREAGHFESVLQERVVDYVLAQDNKDMTMMLIWEVGHLESELQERVVDYVLTSPAAQMAYELAQVVSTVDPEMQVRIVDHAITTGNMDAICMMLADADDLAHALQVRAVDYVLAQNDDAGIKCLVQAADSLYPELQRHVTESLGQHDNLPICTPYNVGRILA